MPILLILHVVLQLRSLAGINTNAQTESLVHFLTSSFRRISVPGAAELLATALHVPVGDLDIIARVAVRCSSYLLCGHLA